MIDPAGPGHDLSGGETGLAGMPGPRPGIGPGKAVAMFLTGALLGSGLTWGWLGYRHPDAGIFPEWTERLGSQVKVETLRAGAGERPKATDVVLISYAMGIEGSTNVLDRGQQVPMPLSGVIEGFQQSVMQMQKGGKYKAHVPARLGYGSRAVGPIPANSNLWFEVELIDFMPAAEYEARMQGAGASQPTHPASPSAGATPAHK